MSSSIATVMISSPEKALSGVVRDHNAIAEPPKKRFSNPSSDHIGELFDTIGMSGLLDDIHWRRSNNESVRKRLNRFVETRNLIAHGNEKKVSKAQVTSSEGFVEKFSEALDEKVRQEIQSVRGVAPW